MQHFSRPDDAPGSFRRSFDRLVGELNVALCAIAIGLAVLDFTCFVTLRTIVEVKRAEHAALLGTPAPAIPTVPLR